MIFRKATQIAEIAGALKQGIRAIKAPAEDTPAVMAEAAVLLHLEFKEDDNVHDLALRCATKLFGNLTRTPQAQPFRTPQQAIEGLASVGLSSRSLDSPPGTLGGLTHTSES